MIEIKERKKERERDGRVEEGKRGRENEIIQEGRE